MLIKGEKGIQSNTNKLSEKLICVGLNYAVKILFEP